MPGSLTVPSRFNGPLTSGNGGYAAGLLAAHLEEGPVEVNLRSPVPLDSPIEVVRDDDGTVRAMNGETLVAEGRPAPGFGLDPPAPVTTEEARAASARYLGVEGELSRCFVCSRSREDGFGVFAGPVEGRELVASPWTPPSWAAGEDGAVRPEFIWAVLDCPTYFATHIERELIPAFMARFTARLDAPASAGEEHVVIAWPIEVDGRKHHAGSALLSGDGELLAVAGALMIEPRAR